MIPKIIHYCWFGRGEMPKLMKKCLKSWKKFCPDWQIVRWDEDSFDVNSTLWTKQAYEARKFAFVSDYVRLRALYEMGGVYLDTDVELVKPLDSFLEHRGFLGFENKISIASCVIGAEARHKVTGEWLDWYRDRAYLSDGKINTEPNVVFMTEILKRKGLVVDNRRQTVDDIEVYPQTWFCPQNIEGDDRAKSRKTVAIHYFDSSWRSPQGRKNIKKMQFHSTKIYKTWEKIKIFPQRTIRKIFGDQLVEKLKERIRK